VGLRPTLDLSVPRFAGGQILYSTTFGVQRRQGGFVLGEPRGGGDKIDADLLTLTYIARGGMDPNCGLLGVERA